MIDMTVSLPRHFLSTCCRKCLNHNKETLNTRSLSNTELFPWQSYLIAGQAVIFSRAQMSENPLLHVFDIFASFDWNAQILHLIDNLGDVICLIQFSSDRFHFFLPKGTVSSAPHGILHKLFRNSADLKLMPMV